MGVIYFDDGIRVLPSESLKYTIHDLLKLSNGAKNAYLFILILLIIGCTNVLLNLVIIILATKSATNSVIPIKPFTMKMAQNMIMNIMKKVGGKKMNFIFLVVVWAV
ncbi:MAG: hypothetical protein Q8760_02035 [Candidatus Phytoplasma australasiaticum]|nr:hypothetical protein [Candidatus Phytoplasma australasiaticum]